MVVLYLVLNDITKKVKVGVFLVLKKDKVSFFELCELEEREI